MSNLLKFPIQTVHKNMAMEPGDMLVRLELCVPMAMARVIIAMIDAPSPSRLAIAGALITP